MIRFPSETLEARRQWAAIFKVLKKKIYESKILYLTKLVEVMEFQLSYFKS